MLKPKIDCTLDLSQLPSVRDIICHSVIRKCQKARWDLEKALGSYSEGSARNDMLAWIEACKETESKGREILEEPIMSGRPA